MNFPYKGDIIKLILSSGIAIEGEVLFWAHTDKRDVVWTSIMNSSGIHQYQQFWIAGFIILNRHAVEDFSNEAESFDDEQHSFLQPQNFKAVKQPDDEEVVGGEDMNEKARKWIDLRQRQGQEVRREVGSLLRRTDVVPVKKPEEIYAVPGFKKHPKEET